MRPDRRIMAVTVAAALAAAGAVAQEAVKEGAGQDVLDDLCAKIQRRYDTVSQDEVIKAFEMGREMGRPYAVSIATKSYMARQREPSLTLLEKAIENAYQVGDLRSAVARSKAYLAVAGTDAKASEVAARMYGVQIDFLGAGDDVYRFMSDSAEKFRKSPAAKKFDSWYLNIAKRRKQYVDFARQLSLVLSDEMPLEQERLHFWEHLDWLAKEIETPTADKFGAVHHCKKIADRIRGDDRRKVLFTFHAANLEFAAGAEGKDRDAVDKSFGPVVDAAKAVVAKFPTADALKVVLTAFDAGGWESQGDAKRALFTEAFSRLATDKDREAILSWRRENTEMAGRIATPEQWAALGERHAELFKSSRASSTVPFVIKSAVPDVFAKQARFLQGVRSRPAAIVNSLAASQDLGGCFEHLAKNESWHLGSVAEVYDLAINHIWPAYQSFPRAEAPLAEGALDTALAQFGRKYIAATPIALFDTQAARAYMLSAWKDVMRGTEKGKMASFLESLDWVPYSKNDREYVLGPAYQEFKRWADAARRDASPAARKKLDLMQGLEDGKAELEKAKQARAAVNPADTRNVQRLDQKIAELEKQVAAATTALAAVSAEAKGSEMDLAQLSPLNSLFRKASDPAVQDIEKAPNELCKRLAEAVAALQANNTAGFVKAARAVYPMVKDYAEKKTPVGRAILRYLVSQGALDTLDFQCEVLDEQLARWSADGQNEDIAEVADAIMRSGKQWDWYQVPKQDRPKALKINAVVAKALEAQMAKGKFSSTLFNWVRGTRRGNDWHERKLNDGILVRMIKDGALPATTLMALASWEFDLPAEYAAGTQFDDMFVAEAKKSKFLDIRYWDNRGKDVQRKVRNVAAELIRGYDSVPMGYGDTQPAYVPEDFWKWQTYALDASPELRNAMLDKIEALYGKSRFDSYARGRPYFEHRADASTPEGRKQFFARLKAYLGRVKEAPDRSGLPSMAALAKIAPETLTDDELDTLRDAFAFDCVPWQWTQGHQFEPMAAALHKALLAKGRDRDLFEMAPHLWKVAEDAGTSEALRAMVLAAEGLLNAKKAELASVYSTLGLDVAGTRLTDVDRNNLNVVRSRALGAFGGVIPVKPSDPRYPVYAAQAEYLAGDVEKAWNEVTKADKLLLQVYRELDPSFLTWVVDRYTLVGQFEKAEELSRTLIQWMDANTENFSPDARLDMLLAYANIAFSRPEYPRAKALYGQIAAAKEFSGLRGQVDAELKMAEIERLTGQPEAAIERLDKMLKRQNRYVQTEGNYHLAKVRFDQKNFDQAKTDLEKVFSLAPTHAEARILDKKIDLKIRLYESATRVEKISLTAEQKLIVPGKPLRVSIEDKSLAVVGRTTDIQIRAWTDSGDEEFFDLRPYADSRTRFEGEIGTALAGLAKSDGTLQVLGQDKVHYDFSDKFRKAHGIEEKADNTLVVVSDSELFASSGKVVSKEEMEKAQIEATIRQKLGLQQAVDPNAKATPLAEVRAGNQVKPGNRISVRVIDPDMSVSAQADKLAILVKTSSGDSIPAFDLTETEPFSGVFEASIPTESAPAAAYATDSDEGSDPNFPISSGDHPAWVALPDSKKPKTFTVDLNDNKFLGQMKLVASVPGRKLKDFVMQISPNGTVFSPIATWPVATKPWDGAPVAEVVKVTPTDETGKPRPRSGTGAIALPAFEAVQTAYRNTAGSKRRFARMKSMAVNWKNDVMGHASALGIGEEDVYAVRFSAAYYVAKRELRTFQLKFAAPAELEALSYSLWVDGQDCNPKARSRDEEVGPPQFRGALKKGVHRIDVYVVGTTKSSPSFELLCDSDKPPYLVPCPAEMFDPELHPEIKEGLEVMSANVTPSEDGGTFDIKFGEGTRGRALRFIIHDYETDAPAIAKVLLSSTDGEAILPTKADLLALRRNQILEIIPGDRITLAYKDPFGVGRNNQVREASLSATYANGTIGAGLVVGYKAGADGMQVPELAQIYRYEVGDSIDITIRDPDVDETDGEDVVKYTVSTFGKEPVELEAKETGPHSGVFAGRIFPVKEDAKRVSEIKVVEGDDLIISYLDKENTEPGVPWVRSAIVDQNWWQIPEVRVYDVASEKIGEGQTPAAGGRRAAPQPAQARKPSGAGAARGEGAEQEALESIPIKYNLVATRPEKPDPQADPHQAVLGGPVLIELIWPTIARSSVSKAAVYVQSESGRKKKAGAAGGEAAAAQKTDAGKVAEATFDPSVPGTVRLMAGLSSGAALRVPHGYGTCTVVGERDAAGGSPAEVGRFMWSVPMSRGTIPDRSLVEVEAERAEGYRTEAGENDLKILGNDTLYVGFLYTNKANQGQWVVSTVKLNSSGALLDVMDKAYVEDVNALHVGKLAYLRVINASQDVSEERDKLVVKLASTSGHQRDLEMTETFAHSGIFKGLVKFTYAVAGLKEMPEGELPVTYGAMVTAKYEPGAGWDPLTKEVSIFKGANGEVTPFSKRFKDPAIAVRTQLAIAEAYFELAKEHRRLKQVEASRVEIAEGKRVLEEATQDYPDTEAQAQADYLLANLSLEFADDAADAQEKQKFYREAVLRFRDIVTTHPESEYAPRSQYKKALALEKLGDFDVACEEYVKLSYRWPEHELIAETIARLGQYFYRKGKELSEKAKAIEDKLEQEKVMIQARDFYRTSAEVFGRLSPRFPSHKLADKTTVLSGQCYMRAEDYGKAVKMFVKVVENPEADKEAKPEAMYWCGDAYFRLESEDSLVQAYRMFKRLTWDFPATKWAKYARGRLAEPEFARVEQ